jgi:hypothetical protein
MNNPTETLSTKLLIFQCDSTFSEERRNINISVKKQQKKEDEERSFKRDQSEQDRDLISFNLVFHLVVRKKEEGSLKLLCFFHFGRIGNVKLT